MATRDPRVDDYVEKAAPFARPILERIRKAVHKGCPDVTEQIKWKHPSFEYRGILCGMSAHKAHVSLWFHRGAAIEDPEGIFGELGKSQMAGLRAESLRDVPTQRVLAAYVKRAVRVNEELHSRPRSPAKRKKKAPTPRTPEVLADALAKNAKAKEFFATLPPSAKRDYIEWITTAKRDATREKRLATAVQWLSEGKRRNWKYERC